MKYNKNLKTRQTITPSQSDHSRMDRYTLSVEGEVNKLKRVVPKS